MQSDTPCWHSGCSNSVPIPVELVVGALKSMMRFLAWSWYGQVHNLTPYPAGRGRNHGDRSCNTTEKGASGRSDKYSKYRSRDAHTHTHTGTHNNDSELEAPKPCSFTQAQRRTHTPTVVCIRALLANSVSIFSGQTYHANDPNGTVAAAHGLDPCQPETCNAPHAGD